MMGVALVTTGLMLTDGELCSVFSRAVVIAALSCLYRLLSLPGLLFAG
jgi:hypothetical protein